MRAVLRWQRCRPSARWLGIKRLEVGPRVCQHHRGLCSASPQVNADTKTLETPFSPRLFTLLDLHSFSDEELHQAFLKFDTNRDGVIERDEGYAMIAGLPCCASLDRPTRERLAEEVWQGLHDKRALSKSDDAGLPVITEEDFLRQTKALASMLDYRVW